ncbi:hypothetical protein C5S42_09840 [Candidatus Methanomarinus sp.]|nr:hypothetical protein C5S42_09840 [ANME-2 cluster archaeon]
MTKQRYREGMGLARLLMVLSSISPLFILWGIRGNSLVPDIYFLLFCGMMVIVPNLFLWQRIRTARKLNEKWELVVGTAEDHREHLLVYLFAMLLPFYAADLGTYRDLAAALAALGFIVFLFWHLNLHYMNLFFALFGYRVFTINPPADNNPFTGKVSQVLITRRTLVLPGDSLVVYGLSDTVTMEIEE